MHQQCFAATRWRACQSQHVKVTPCSDFCLRKTEELVTPTRRVLMEGDFLKLSKGKNQERHFVLFNDIILYARIINKKREQYQFKDKLDLKLTVASEILDADSMCNAITSPAQRLVTLW
jgi:hypothetical protein